MTGLINKPNDIEGKWLILTQYQEHIWMKISILDSNNWLSSGSNYQMVAGLATIPN